jgi:hypothetical protein
MKPIIKKIDCQEYITRIENQKECLKFSLWFSDEEKIKVAIIFDELIELANNSLAREHGVKVDNFI